MLSTMCSTSPGVMGDVDAHVRPDLTPADSSLDHRGHLLLQVENQSDRDVTLVDVRAVVASVRNRNVASPSGREGACV